MPKLISTLLRALAMSGLAALIPLDAAAQGRRDRAEHRIDTTFTFAPGGRLEIELPHSMSSADVVVTGWNRNEVRIDGAADEGRLDVDVTSRTVTIGARNANGSPRVDRLAVSVPAGTRVHVNNRMGDISVEGTRGEVDLVTFNGDIVVRDAADRLDVKTFNGDVRITDVVGRTSISASNGDLELENIRGDVTVSSLNGDIDLRGITSTSVRAKTMNGEIAYDGSFDPVGQYRFDAFSGGIDIVMPRNVGATLTISTFSGTVDSEFPLTLKPGGQSKASRGKSMTFTLGGGGARVELESFSGEIRIRERSTGSRQ